MWVTILIYLGLVFYTTLFSKSFFAILVWYFSGIEVTDATALSLGRIRDYWGTVLIVVLLGSLILHTEFLYGVGTLSLLFPLFVWRRMQVHLTLLNTIKIPWVKEEIRKRIYLAIPVWGIGFCLSYLCFFYADLRAQEFEREMVRDGCLMLTRISAQCGETVRTL